MNHDEQWPGPGFGRGLGWAARADASAIPLVGDALAGQGLRAPWWQPRRKAANGRRPPSRRSWLGGVAYSCSHCSRNDRWRKEREADATARSPAGPLQKACRIPLRVSHCWRQSVGRGDAAPCCAWAFRFSSESLSGEVGWVLHHSIGMLTLREIFEPRAFESGETL